MHGVLVLICMAVDGTACQPSGQPAPHPTLEAPMARNPKDFTPEPPGGRALERLRQFEDARRPPKAVPKDKQNRNDEVKPRDKDGGDPHEKPD